MAIQGNTYYLKRQGQPECHTTVDDIIRNSKAFPISFPEDTMTCKSLRQIGVADEVLDHNINSVYPILHEVALSLFQQFLSHKGKFGSAVEKAFYKDMSVYQLVDRLLQKRAVVFYSRKDKFMLLDGLMNAGNWEIIGTDAETPPRILQNCLSYDEIKLSSLLSVSSYTYFINRGDRDNAAKFNPNREELEDTGVIIGLIGTRLSKPDVMEYQEIILSKEQNVHGKGYGQSFVPTMKSLFINFYGESSLTYDELEHDFVNETKYTKLRDGKYFHNYIYDKRISLSIDTLLLEANVRAIDAKKMAYVHVVGIGLGVWRASKHQNKLFMDAFYKRIHFLGSTLTNVSDIRFSYINQLSCGGFKDGEVIPIETHPSNGIRIHIKNSNPHTRLGGADKGKLLVVSYAWDGNALPGNEFWVGMLGASGDPAAACSTQIAELHNPHINPQVKAANLRIATLRGVEKFSDYIRKLSEASLIT